MRIRPPRKHQRCTAAIWIIVVMASKRQVLPAASSCLLVFDYGDGVERKTIWRLNASAPLTPKDQREADKQKSLAKKRG